MISDFDDIDVSMLAECERARIFVPHWSEIIPAAIHDSIETICFHMTDLPWGRGGSPLQHLILAGRETTKLTAFRCSGELDAGPVYVKRDLSLEGRAEDILVRAALLMVDMIIDISLGDLRPSPQVGLATTLRRRRPHQSCLPSNVSGKELYDFIRMLDADGYPPAYSEVGGLRIEYRSATLATDGPGGEPVVTASVTIRTAGHHG
jgi:methionyl-tRNA formyltransferase